jgi:hypothetical protein
VRNYDGSGRRWRSPSRRWRRPSARSGRLPSCRGGGGAELEEKDGGVNAMDVDVVVLDD